MKHKVKIIYPGQKTFEFNRFSNGDMNLFFDMLIREWQHKSTRECATFLDSKIRSFCNNDFIKVDDTCYQYTPFGMKEVTEQFVNSVENKIKNHKYVKEKNDYFWAKLEVMDELETKFYKKHGGYNSYIKKMISNTKN
jgi:hypothetical protein